MQTQQKLHGLCRSCCSSPSKEVLNCPCDATLSTSLWPSFLCHKSPISHHRKKALNNISEMWEPIQTKWWWWWQNLGRGCLVKSKWLQWFMLDVVFSSSSTRYPTKYLHPGNRVSNSKGQMFLLKSDTQDCKELACLRTIHLDIIIRWYLDLPKFIYLYLP